MNSKGQELKSYPVGYIATKQENPLDHELLALGQNQQLEVLFQHTGENLTTSSSNGIDHYPFEVSSIFEEVFLSKTFT